MDWKPGKWKLNLKEGRDRWLVVLAVGLIFLILAFPAGGKSGRGTVSRLGLSAGQSGAEGQSGAKGQTAAGSFGGLAGSGLAGSGLAGNGLAGNGPDSQTGPDGATSQDSAAAVQTGASAAATYEQQLELRLKELLSHVEGVGEVEVMIVLKSSEEKVWRTDRSSSVSSTRETDSNGGTRDVRSQEISEDTILTGTGDGDGPLLEKELKPEIGGVVVSATGGGSPAIQAEISAAVEALFDVPSHKIKVLKRAE